MSYLFQEINKKPLSLQIMLASMPFCQRANDGYRGKLLVRTPLETATNHHLKNVFFFCKSLTFLTTCTA